MGPRSTARAQRFNCNKVLWQAARGRACISYAAVLQRIRHATLVSCAASTSHRMRRILCNEGATCLLTQHCRHCSSRTHAMQHRASARLQATVQPYSNSAEAQEVRFPNTADQDYRGTLKNGHGRDQNGT